MNSLSVNFTSSRIMYGGLALVLTLVSGVVLSSLGRPLNSVVFGLHKIIAMGTIILLGLTIKNQVPTADLQIQQIILIIIAGLLFLTLVVTGILLSFERPVPTAVLRIHQIVPWLTLVVSSVTAYFLVNSRS